MKTHREYVKIKQQDPKFKEAYEIEKEMANIAIKITRSRLEQGLSLAELAKKAHSTKK